MKGLRMSLMSPLVHVKTVCLVLYLFTACDATHNGSAEFKKTSSVYLYRLLNWCVVGRGEYLLNEWPLNQFQPILRKDFKNEREWDKSNSEKLKIFTDGKDPWTEYKLEFSSITCGNKMPTGFGKENTFLNRIHIKLVPTANAVRFQGLLIQAVHAPFGLGFPFGAFDTDQEFTCKDTCKHFHYSRIIGCISRPDFAPMHPTVAVYHHKLRGPDINRKADKEKKLDYDFQKELHWNFKWANLPCSSARLVEFWVLMVVDFERNAWTVKKFGPYDFNQDKEPFTSLEKPHKVVEKPFTHHPGLPTPIHPTCFPHKNPPIQYGSAGKPKACLRNFKAYNETACSQWEQKLRRTLADKPTSETNKAGGIPFLKAMSPNEMNCHATAVTPTDAAKKTRVRFVGDFDVQCTRRYPGEMFTKIYGKSKRQPHKVCPEWQGRFACQGVGEAGDLHYDFQVDDAGPDGDRPFPFSHCEPCKAATEEVTVLPSDEVPFFKRSEHGVLMIYAFFFFNPVSLNVARFYKETLHEHQVKGWRLWLIIHVGFAAMSSCVAYIGYTFPSFKDIDAHIGLGYGALIGISSGIVTGWIRHKDNSLQECMFYLHALSGYLGWGLAIASMAFAPGISRWTRLISYMASGICLAAMAIMTVHICTVDDSIGMRPKRSHIPIIEIRFDDIIPPVFSDIPIIFAQFIIFVHNLLVYTVCVLSTFYCLTKLTT